MSDNLSDDCIAAAKALARVRARITELVRTGNWPDGQFRDLSKVLTDGLYVIYALNRLGKDTGIGGTNDGDE